MVESIYAAIWGKDLSVWNKAWELFTRPSQKVWFVPGTQAQNAQWELPSSFVGCPASEESVLSAAQILGEL